MQQNKPQILPAPIWMVCWASYIRGRFSFVRTPDFPGLLVWGSGVIWVGHRPFVACLRVAAVKPMSDALQKPSCWGEHCILFRISSNNRALFPLI